MNAEDKKLKVILKSKGFEYPKKTKAAIFKRIIENLEEPMLLNINDLFILSDTTEAEVINIFNSEFITLITNVIQKNVVTLKVKTIQDLTLNADAASKKLLLQLTTNREQYDKISNQWSISPDDLEEWEVEGLELADFEEVE